MQSFYLWWSRVLRAGTDPTSAADRVGKSLVVPHLGETQRSLAAHAYRQSPAAGIGLLDINDLQDGNMGRPVSQGTGFSAGSLLI